MRAEIGLADLLRAWDAVGRDPGALEPLSRLLGWAPPVASTEAQAPQSVPTGTEEQPKDRTVVEPKRPRELDTRTPLYTDDARDQREVVLGPAPDQAPEVPPWLAVAPLPPAAAPVGTALPAPLFVPQRERALLAAAARRLRAEGDLDLQTIAEALARRELPRPLPRRRVPSLRGGMQLVLDSSSWMAPFAADVARIARRFREIAGDSIDELWVPVLPPGVGRRGRGQVRPWTPPPAGAAVVVVSDLGRAAQQQGHQAPGAAWRAILLEMQSAGLDPVVLCPGRAERYDREGLDPQRTLLLGWDRSARLAELLHFRRGRGR